MSLMSVLNVPSEVLDQIFHYLPLSAVGECIFVCKSWNATASRVIYYDITLNNKNAIQFVTSLCTGQQKGVWVKHLAIGEASLSPSDFLGLLYQLNSLRTLDLRPLEKHALPFIDAILSSQDKGGQLLPCIEDIKMDCTGLSRKDKEKCLLVAYQFRESLTKLHLSYLKIMKLKQVNYLDFLPQFPNLTQLFISNDLFTGDRYMTLYPLLKACPKLTHFKLHTTRHFPDGSQPLLLNYMQQDKQPQINQHMQSLEFNMRDFDQAYMKYITLYTPKFLDSFELFMPDADFYDWLQDNVGFINTFGHHLGTVKNTSITAFTPGMTLPSRRIHHGRQSTAVTQDKMNRHWTFVDAVMGRQYRQVHLHVYLSISSYQDYQNFKLKVVDNKTMVLRYGLKPEHPTNNLVAVLTPHMMPKCLAGPGLIDSIEVGDAIRYTLGDCLQVLEYALRYCPKMVFILINRAELCYRLEYQESINLKFDQHKLKTGQGRDYIHNRKRNRIVQQKDHSLINHVSFTGASITPELLQVLCNYAPETKVLLLNCCSIPYDDINGSRVTLNLQGIHHLHYLKLEITHILPHPFGHVFVVFEYSQEAVCYKAASQPGKLEFVRTSSQYVYDFLDVSKHAQVDLITIQCGDKLVDTVEIYGTLGLKPAILYPKTDTMPFSKGCSFLCLK